MTPGRGSADRRGDETARRRTTRTGFGARCWAATAVALVTACSSPATLAGIGGTTATRATAPTTTAADAGAEAAPVLPVTLVDGTGVTVVVSSVARIVPVDGDVAEIVFALGLGDQVVATDLSAMYPPEAAARPRIGYQRALNAEPIAAVAPTLVLATDLARPVEALAQIRSLGIPLVVVRRTMDLGGPAAKIRAVAAALGVPGRGEVLARRVEGELEQAAAVARRAVTHPKVLVLYVRGEQVQLILGHGSGIDAVLAAAGATDVASELGFADSQPITAEAMLRAAPDVLVVTTTGLASVGGLDGLLSIHAIARTPAGQQRRVLAFEDQYLLGAGPRTGQLLGELTRALHPSSN